MIGEVIQYSNGETGLETVTFVLFDEAAFGAFRQELASRKGPKGTP
jgi:hypothetical protein